MKPDGQRLLLRVEMWCARNWVEAQYAAREAHRKNRHTDFLAHSLDERDWFAALLVVNRINLGLEPNEGKTFLEGRQ